MDVKKLDFISNLFKRSEVIVSTNNNKFYLTSYDSGIEKLLLENEIQFTAEGREISLKLKTSLNENLVSFDSLKYFEPEFLESEFLILDAQGNYYYYNFDGTILKSTIQDGTFINICENIFAYFLLLQSIQSPAFADHYNGANAEIILYSSINGICKIQYDLVPDLPSNKSFLKSTKKLLESMNLTEFKQYYKNAIFVDNSSGVTNLTYILLNSENIIYTANRDYELVSKQFNFEKFRDSLYKEKEKYFTNIRDVISKIFSQAIGIPVSISATAFATYKIGNDNVILVIVLTTFMLYIAFYIKLQLIYKKDLLEIKSDFESDFDIIKSNSGLEEGVITKEKNKILYRLSSSLDIITLLILAIILLGGLMVAYILYQIFRVDNPLLIFVFRIVFGFKFF